MTQKIKFCKFCGSKVVYLVELNDHFCPKCKMYQSTPVTVKKGLKVQQVHQDVYSQVKAELERFHREIKSPWQDTPFTPNRPMAIRKLKMTAGRFGIFDSQKNTLGSIKIIQAIVDRDFTILDAQNNRVGYVNAHVGLLELQKRKYDIFDNEDRLRGTITRKIIKKDALILVGLRKFIYEIFDGTETLIYIGKSSQQIGRQARFVSNNKSEILLMFEYKHQLFNVEHTLLMNPLIDPLILLAYFMIIRYPEGK